MSGRLPKNLTERIINDLGGAVHVANMLNISREAIVQWVRNDKIPTENGARLLGYATLHYPNQHINLFEIFHHVDDPFLQAGLKRSVRYQEMAA